MPEQPGNRWQPLPPHLHSDMRLQLALLVAHRRIYYQHFAQDPMSNPALGFHLHDFRRNGSWRSVLMLTPWMLSRLLFAETPPPIEIPEDWRGEQRGEDDYRLTGPVIDLPPLTRGVTTHLNYHPTLGHYLLQPLVLDMQPYASACEVLQAHHDTTPTRAGLYHEAATSCDHRQVASRAE